MSLFVKSGRIFTTQYTDISSGWCQAIYSQIMMVMVGKKDISKQTKNKNKTCRSVAEHGVPLAKASLDRLNWSSALDDPSNGWFENSLQ